MADSISISSVGTIASVLPAMPGVPRAVAAAPVPAPSPAAAPGPASTPPQIAPQTSQQIEAYLRATGRTMQTSIDSITNQPITRIYNSANGELVRQIPTEVLVRLADMQALDVPHAVNVTA